MWLVAVDTLQIQPYIFGSNRLRENVGASYLVDMATGDWACEAVKDAAPTNNLGPGHLLRDDARIEDGLEAEVLYAGGGNFVVLFREDRAATAFTSTLSRYVLQEAPGLQLEIARQEMDWHKDVLRDRLDEVLHRLAVQKRQRARPAPLLGLGVTAACRSTGLPATGVVRGIGDDPDYLASDEIRTKVDVAWPGLHGLSMADRRLQATIKLEAGYRYPADFEDLGSTVGEYSHIAVVHADGNSIGQRLREIGAPYSTADKNRECVLARRDFSRNLKQAAQSALQAVLNQLVQEVCEQDGQRIIGSSPNPKNPDALPWITLKRKGSEFFIPLRPLVFGGDDVTFVCDGRLGLALTTAYLQEFERQTEAAGLGKDRGRLTACAGVAIVKGHYPFARAYQLAADLTGSAKVYRRTCEAITGSCLDWHFALSGLGGSIDEIRAREYTVPEGSLVLRPVTLENNPVQSQHAWPVIWRGIQEFQGKEWADRRNKIKALRDALREGPAAVKHFIAVFNDGAHLPSVLSEMGTWPETGWQGKFCGYFDAIELADWFIPLQGGADETPATAPAT